MLSSKIRHLFRKKSIDQYNTCTERLGMDRTFLSLSSKLESLPGPVSDICRLLGHKVLYAYERFIILTVSKESTQHVTLYNRPYRKQSRVAEVFAQPGLFIMRTKQHQQQRIHTSFDGCARLVFQAPNTMPRGYGPLSNYRHLCLRPSVCIGLSFMR